MSYKTAVKAKAKPALKPYKRKKKASGAKPYSLVAGNTIQWGDEAVKVGTLMADKHGNLHPLKSKGVIQGIKLKPGSVVAANISKSPLSIKKLGKSYFQQVTYSIPANLNELYENPALKLGGEEAPSVVESEAEAELADKLVTEVADHAPDVKTLCEKYQLKREELGRLTGFSLRALAEWANHKLPSQPAKRRLQEVRRLLDALSEFVKPESIPRWLHQPNPAFDRLTPLQVIELGEIDRLWGMVHDMALGQPE